jgi:hypothetical protein
MASSQTGGCLNACAGLAKEESLSQTNGDKARFNREQKRKVLRRKISREFRKAVEGKTTGTAIVAPK